MRGLKLTISNVNKESDSVSLWASLESSQKNVRTNSGGIYNTYLHIMYITDAIFPYILISHNLHMHKMHKILWLFMKEVGYFGDYQTVIFPRARYSR